MSLTSLALSNAQRNSLERATAAYEEQMTEEAALFLKGRGLDRDAAIGARLGYVAEPTPEHEKFRGRLSIPYLSPSGVVGMKFRTIDGSEPKILPPEGQKTRLFNTRDLFRPEDFVLLCEGEFDTIIASGMLGLPAVGVPGAGSPKPHWPRCFADFDRVILVLDNDIKTRTNKEGVEEPFNPGQLAARKWADVLPQAVVIPPPLGEDLNSWYLKEGAEAVLKGLGLTRNNDMAIPTYGKGDTV